MLLLILVELATLFPACQAQFGGFGGGGQVRDSPSPTTAAPTALPATLTPTVAPMDASVAPTVKPRVESAAERVFFTFSYGFESGTIREPTVEDMEELICATNKFIAAKCEETLVEKAELNPAAYSVRPIRAFATNVDWTYQPDDPFIQVEVTFLADVRYADADVAEVSNSNPIIVYKGIVFDAFELDGDEVSAYITDHLWSLNYVSVFFNTVRVNYNVRQNNALTDPGQLPDGATCPGYTRTPSIAPITTAPTGAPSISPAPTNYPTISVQPSVLPSSSTAPSMVPSIAPSSVPSVMETITRSETEDMVYFKLEVVVKDKINKNDGESNSGNRQLQDGEPGETMDEDSEIVEAFTEDDMVIFVCHTNTFLMDAMHEALGDDTITTKASNIHFITSRTTAAAAMTIHFTADIEYGEGSTRGTAGEPVRNDLVVKALYGHGDTTAINNALMQHMKQQTTHGSWLSNLEEISLQDLPVGTPVRVGIRDVDECPTEAPTVAPLNSNIGNNSPGEFGLNLPGNSDNDNNNENDNGIKQDGNELGRDTDLLYEEPTMTILLEFMVSNLVSLTSPNDVLNDGLRKSFPVFMEDLVPRLQDAPANSNLRQRQRLLDIQKHRSLHDYGTIELLEGSARAYQATKVECGPFVHPDLTCHEVRAKFDIIMPVHEDHEDDTLSAAEKLTLEDANDIRRIYQVASYRAILDGTFYSVLRREAPDTSLFIGTVPPPSDTSDGKSGGLAGVVSDASTSDWVVIVLSILLAVVCCCVLCCLAQRCYEHRVNKQLEEDEQYELEMMRQEAEIEKELQLQEERRASNGSLHSVLTSDVQSQRESMKSERSLLSSRRSLGTSDRSLGSVRSVRANRSQRIAAARDRRSSRRQSWFNVI